MKIQYSTAIIFQPDIDPLVSVRTFDPQDCMIGSNFLAAVHLPGSVNLYGQDRETIAAALLAIVSALAADDAERPAIADRVSSLHAEIAYSLPGGIGHTLAEHGAEPGSPIAVLDGGAA